MIYVYQYYTILFPYLWDETNLQLEWARHQSRAALDSPFYRWGGCTTRSSKLIVTICNALHTVFARKIRLSNFRQGKCILTNFLSLFDSNIRHVRQEAIQFIICHKMAAAGDRSTTLSPCSSFFLPYAGRCSQPKGGFRSFSFSAARQWFQYT